MDKVVVLGAGLAGISALRRLEKYLDKIDITIIDKNGLLLNPYGPFELLWERRPFLKCNIKKVVNYIKDNVISIEPDEQRIYLENSNPIFYDYLIIALGRGFLGRTKPVDGDIPYTLCNPEDINVIGEHLSSLVKRVSWKDCIKKEEKILTFAVVGKEKTAVELACAVSETFKGKRYKGYIITQSKKMFYSINNILYNKLEEVLIRKGITVINGHKVNKVDKNGITLDNGRFIESYTSIWTYGGKDQTILTPVLSSIGEERNITVNNYMQTLTYSNIFAAGGCTYIHDKDGNKIPITEGFSIVQGQIAADNIISLMLGEKMKKYYPIVQNQIIRTGRREGVGQILGHPICGLIPYLLKVEQTNEIIKKLR